MSLFDYRVLTQQVRKFTAMRSGRIDLQGSNLVVFISSERSENKKKTVQRDLQQAILHYVRSMRVRLSTG